MSGHVEPITPQRPILPSIEERKFKQLTVGELIAILQKFPADLLAWHEGCDCIGAANGVELCEEGVLITRGNW